MISIHDMRKILGEPSTIHRKKNTTIHQQEGRACVKRAALDTQMTRNDQDSILTMF